MLTIDQFCTIIRIVIRLVFKYHTEDSNIIKESEVIIIGQGPAGLSAAIYTSRAGISTVILGCDPKVAGEYDIDNYFGFPETISGKDLIDRGLNQALRFGATQTCDRVLAIHFDDSGKYIVKTENDEYSACCIILATGVSRKKPDIPGLDKYKVRASRTV